MTQQCGKVFNQHIHQHLLIYFSKLSRWSKYPYLMWSYWWQSNEIFFLCGVAGRAAHRLTRNWHSNNMRYITHAGLVLARRQIVHNKPQCPSVFLIRKKLCLKMWVSDRCVTNVRIHVAAFLKQPTVGYSNPTPSRESVHTWLLMLNLILPFDKCWKLYDSPGLNL